MERLTQQGFDAHVACIVPILCDVNATIMDIYTNPSPDIKYKSDNSPVTTADTISHDIIVKRLNRCYPDIPVLSEEGSIEQNNNIVQSSASFWLVDPIDGTKDFINKTDEFTVCIALIIGNRPVMGFVSAPALDGEIYYGGSDFGSFIIVGTSPAQRLQPQSTTNNGVVFGGGSVNYETKQYIDEHYPGTPARQIGSQLKFVEVAKGNGVYPRLSHTMKLWDIGAGHAIIEGVGGTVTRPDRTDINYRNATLLAGDFIAKL